MSTRSANKSLSTRTAEKRPPTRSANRPQMAESVEIRLKGPGVTTFGLVDGTGNVLMARRVAVSGPGEMEAGFQMPLSLSTASGEIAAVPMLFHQTSAKQVVTVGGKDAAVAATERQHALKLDAASVAKIKAATEAATARIGESGRLTMPPRR